VYIRQSTPGQVKNNLESQQLQYVLVDRARHLGWGVDEGLGCTASGIHRPGFERMLGSVCEGKIGAIFSIEASRLARTGRDWHTLLEFCGVVGVLLKFQPSQNLHTRRIGHFPITCIANRATLI
jgi:DNA invertase Pin-like site-specific DNA recombinase